MLAAETMLLLERMSAHNDEQALKRLFDLYYPRLLPFAISFLKNKPVAEEVVEDVFIRLWQHRANLPAITSFTAYLFTATKNGILNYQKSAKNQPYFDIDQVSLDLNTVVKNPEELLISAQALQNVNAIIASLPPKCRLIFQLIKENGLKYREAAELLNISIKTVEHQMSLALKKISEALLEERQKTTALPRQKK